MGTAVPGSTRASALVLALAFALGRRSRPQLLPTEVAIELREVVAELVADRDLLGGQVPVRARVLALGHLEPDRSAPDVAIRQKVGERLEQLDLAEAALVDFVFLGRRVVHIELGLRLLGLADVR